jgi:hypothetical protein
MKKILSFLFFFLFIIPAFGNPMPPRIAVVSELQFMEGNNWILEIGFLFGNHYEQGEFDSICIRNSSGYSRIVMDNIPDGTTQFILTADSLPGYFDINRNGDYITVLSYRTDITGALIDSVSFGDFPGSKFPGLLPYDYSICRLTFFIKDWGTYDIYCRDKSPTIGFPNDTAGTNGILTGYMYDKNNTLITDGSFLIDHPVYFDSTGLFSCSIPSGVLHTNHIWQKYFLSWIPAEIDTLHFDIYPDSGVVNDIHFKNYIVGVNDPGSPEEYALEVINYPNPFNSSTSFYIKIPPGFIYEKSEINIYSINGEIVNTINIKEGTPAVWNGVNRYGETVSSGIYYYQLALDGKVHKSGSMILLK